MAILIASQFLLSCSDKGKLIYGKWYLLGKENTIEFRENGKIFGKKKGQDKIEFVGYFYFNDEDKTLELKDCKKSPDNGTFKVLKLDGHHLKLERDGTTMVLNRL